MPETISEEAKQELLQKLQDALGLVADADTSAHDVAAITHSAADGHQLTEVMLQQMTTARGYLKACADQIEYAVNSIEAIPLDPPPDD
ncbi:hypothetical protein FK256_08670 [Actinomyces johnsonii]|uniref:Uncharacterized protein n=1 Tax=Actinomyces johnsonii TaxID=544581 RepID=A0A508A2K7_9ACTO|nr:hypothetical protein [Actinomyces johnsonii]KAA8739430.1 hypothetical protein F4W10_09530 [Actinomyces johnsonii]TQD42704.1 hypothetical protein FK256_08670 [Actinomyces johnsonii]